MNPSYCSSSIIESGQVSSPNYTSSGRLISTPNPSGSDFLYHPQSSTTGVSNDDVPHRTNSSLQGVDYCQQQQINRGDREFCDNHPDGSSIHARSLPQTLVPFIRKIHLLKIANGWTDDEAVRALQNCFDEALIFDGSPDTWVPFIQQFYELKCYCEWTDDEAAHAFKGHLRGEAFKYCDTLPYHIQQSFNELYIKLLAWSVYISVHNPGLVTAQRGFQYSANVQKITLDAFMGNAPISAGNRCESVTNCLYRDDGPLCSQQTVKPSSCGMPTSRGVLSKHNITASTDDECLSAVSMVNTDSHKLLQCDEDNSLNLTGLVMTAKSQSWET